MSLNESNFDFQKLMQIYADKLDSQEKETRLDDAEDVHADEILDEPDISDDSNGDDDDEEDALSITDYSADEDEHSDRREADHNSKYALEELIDTIEHTKSDSESDSEADDSPREPVKPKNPQVERLASLEKTIRELEILLKIMSKKKTLFDDEDRDWVASDLSNLSKEYSHKKKLYLKSVLPLEKIISARQEILSSVRCMESRPELLNKFIEKQVAITQILQTHKSQIANSSNE